MKRNTSSASCCTLTAKQRRHCPELRVKPHKCEALMLCVCPYVEPCFCPNSGGSLDGEQVEGSRSSWPSEPPSGAAGRYGPPS